MFTLISINEAARAEAAETVFCMACSGHQLDERLCDERGLVLALDL
ncbi:hypothetical protein [Caballeronia arationis]|jgi:hypothetical protein|nr:hypothetical protein [Caballeronia arationis]